MRALVTGASGFVGSRLVRRLLAEGIEVRGTYRRTLPAIEGVDWRAVSQLDSQDQWHELMRDTEVVLHLAALAHQVGRAGVGRTEEFQRVNVQGTRAVASACRVAGVRRLIFVSSIAVYGRQAVQVDEQTPTRPQDDYGSSKLQAEQALRSELTGSEIDWCILRPPLVYGPGNPGNMRRLLRLIGKGLPLPFGAIRNLRSFIFVDNLVDACLTVLRYPHGIRATFVLSDGSDFATPELVAALSSCAHRRVRLVSVPVRVLKAIGRFGDLTQRLLGVGDGWDSYSIERLCGSLIADGSLFRSRFDWHPPVERMRAIGLTCGAEKCGAHPES